MRFRERVWVIGVDLCDFREVFGIFSVVSGVGESNSINSMFPISISESKLEPRPVISIVSGVALSIISLGLGTISNISVVMLVVVAVVIWVVGVVSGIKGGISI